MFQKYTKAIICFISIFWIVILFCLVLIGSEKVTISISNFAVDSNDRLYIGTPTKICVYENGQLLTTLNPHTSRAYAFTITEEEQILLSTASTVYLMDLAGNTISQEEDPGADMYNQLQYNRKHFISAKGDYYCVVDAIGRTKIIKNSSEIIYQLSMLSFCVKILLISSVIAMFSFGIWILIQVSKHQNRTAAGQGTTLYPESNS